jgi:hypothetical protein
MRIHDISISLVGVVCGVAVLSAAGCGGKDVQVQNQGQLCVGGSFQFGPPDTAPRDYAAGSAVTVAVLFPPGCLSSTCMTNPMAGCMIAQSGNTFTVSGTASYHDTGDDACSADCRLLTASCETPVLAEGTFTFKYAGASVDLVVPSTVPPPCVGTAFGS